MRPRLLVWDVGGRERELLAAIGVVLGVIGSPRSLPGAALALCALLVLSACGTPNSILAAPGSKFGAAAQLNDGSSLPPARSPAASQGSPIALTTPDGNALTLVALEAKSVLQGPLAFTELHLTFYNPEARTIEGGFRIALPQSASLSRLAMKTGDGWQEGEVVEKKEARRIYEDFLHRRIDPALLEQGAGNEFNARIFPIEPNARKEIIVSYSQELTANQATLVALRGLPEVAHLALSVSTGDGKSRVFQRTNHRPTSDFVADSKGSGVSGVRSGNLMVARIKALPKASTVDGARLSSCRRWRFCAAWTLWRHTRRALQARPSASDRLGRNC